MKAENTIMRFVGLIVWAIGIGGMFTELFQKAPVEVGGGGLLMTTIGAIMIIKTLPLYTTVSRVLIALGLISIGIGIGTANFYTEGVYLLFYILLTLAVSGALFQAGYMKRWPEMVLVHIGQGYKSIQYHPESWTSGSGDRLSDGYYGYSPRGRFERIVTRDGRLAEESSLMN